MNLFKVLVADDDPNVRDILRIYFEQHQIEMIEAQDGLEAVQLTEKTLPDMIVMDVMMPRMNGLDACKEIQNKFDIPIIMLTAKSEEIDRILGLELGADDYITKPFSPRELIARIKAVSRRAKSNKLTQTVDEDYDIYEFRNLTINKHRYEVIVHGEKVHFRPKEFDLLAHMAKSPGSVYTRERLLEQVWGYDFMGDARTVDVHVKKIREKLCQFQLECIKTVWGVGYKFEADI